MRASRCLPPPGIIIRRFGNGNGNGAARARARGRLNCANLVRESSACYPRGTENPADSMRVIADVARITGDQPSGK